MALRFSALALLTLTLLTACEDEPAQNTCPDGEVYDKVLERCVRLLDGDVTEDSTSGDTQSDTGSPDTGSPDTGSPDTAEEVEIFDPTCDMDNDGVYAERCGGTDCDDDNRERSPERDEICDFIDNNCNEVVNEGLDCTFYAHSSDTLYAIDPFAKSAEIITTIPRFSDIDTHPNGDLYGISEDDGFYLFDADRFRWYLIGTYNNVSERTSGLAINNFGDVFMTAGPSVYEVDFITGEATLIGPLGGTLFSSGDCVVNKYNDIFMTSKDFENPDELILIDSLTGEGEILGSTGFRNIFGLTWAWGTLYGLTSRGEMITINPETGEGALYHTFEDIGFFGAASSPGR